ncbi:Cathepsin_B [Hexamita inflata]|uniref:Cathepsin B n=1 Tax=Hexamita inflata TaxID=28002 RepID=A0AA86NBX2_9EUKA|nr:Cathepsin B [Hexamita inflata]
MIISISLCSSILQHLEVLKNIPDLKWTPGVSNFLASKSQQELDLLFTPKTAQLLPRKTYSTKSPSTDVPDYIDWSQTHPQCVNVVRDMKNCGSSQVFSTTSILSDLRCIQKKDAQRIQYSEQYVFNCNQDGAGCKYTNDERVFDFLVKSGSVPESCIHLKSDTTGQAEKCQRTCDDGSFQKSAGFKGYEEISSEWFDDQPVFEMEKALVDGPISVLFDLYEDFMFYTGGIYEHKYGKFLDYHRAEVVGYDEEGGVEYWKVKLQYGSQFGENGFVRIIKGQDEGQIESYATVFSL